MMRHFIFIVILFFASLFTALAGGFVGVQGTHFVRDGKPYFYIGTNMWYAPLLASPCKGGDRDRLKYELDSLKSLGVSNVRVLIGTAEGGLVKSTMLAAGSKLNKDLLLGLDFFLDELRKRNMVGVLCLSSSQSWSGGLNVFCSGNDCVSASDSKMLFADFLSDTEARKLFLSYVEQIISRKNSYSGVLYKNDPAIMTWEICDIARPYMGSAALSYMKWLSETASLIKRLDNCHLVATGCPGIIRGEISEDLYERIHGSLAVDYVTWHISPLDLDWVSMDRLYAALPNVYVNFNMQLRTYQRVASRLGKPLVVEDFSYPRDYNTFSSESTVSRDSFFKLLFKQVVKGRSEGGAIAGCNFNGWGGMARPAEGSDYNELMLLADPPHIKQGRFSVYDADSTTLTLIKKNTELLKY